MRSPSPRSTNLPVTRRQNGSRLFTNAEFQELAAVPAAVVCFANLDNPNTRRAYRNDVEDFMAFLGIERPDQLRAVTRWLRRECRLSFS